ncbi:unnamed protein product [Agarophyton chilense]
MVLHPCRARVPNPFASKIGGRIAWPDNEEWPRCPVHHSAMVSVVQLRRCDAPQLVFPDRTNLFQLLWCPSEGHGETAYPILKTFWRESKTISSVLKDVPHDFEDADDDFVPKECELLLDEVEDYPSPFLIDEAQLERIDEYIAQHATEDIKVIDENMDEPYSSMFAAAPISKVGGHVSWIQDPETVTCVKCGKEMHHLLTISSQDSGRSTGRWNVLVDESGNVFKKNEMTREFDIGLCLGDVGSYYVMVCRKCEDRPIETVFQCS